VTRDNTPTIFLRLDDAVLLNDLPGNAAGVPGALPPDEVIPIPHNPSTATSPVNLMPGYRVAVFDETDMHNPVPLGFAQPVPGLPGVYSFTFTTPLVDGSHFLSARVQMIDPADNSAEAATLLRATGFGARSQSLEIIVDTVPPPVVFGSAADPFDGLLPPGDTHILPNPGTISDRITSVLAPTFWGRAEANAIIRLYADVDGDGLLDPAVDVFLGQTTAIPLDGTNQEPNGYWQIQSVVNLNNPDFFPRPGWPADGLRTIFVTAEDLAGNVNALDGAAADVLQIFIDTQGPVIEEVFITGAPEYNLFAPKPDTRRPHPAGQQLDHPVHRSAGTGGARLPVRCLEARRGGASRTLPAGGGPQRRDPDRGRDRDAGDRERHCHRVGGTGVPRSGPRRGVLHRGRHRRTVAGRSIHLDHLRFDHRSGGQPAGRRDQRDPAAGNAALPDRRRHPRRRLRRPFTVDSRPEIAVYHSGTVWVDTNGNFIWDPDNADFTNRDITYVLGVTTDKLFVGNFANDNGVATVSTSWPLMAAGATASTGSSTTTTTACPTSSCWNRSGGMPRRWRATSIPRFPATRSASSTVPAGSWTPRATTTSTKWWRFPACGAIRSWATSTATARSIWPPGRRALSRSLWAARPAVPDRWNGIRR
jgi:hypothetical protein